MQAVILAAGKGSRLHPITTNRSKAMLPILGKPIVERVMEHLAINGIDDFILVVSPDDYPDHTLLPPRIPTGSRCALRLPAPAPGHGRRPALRCPAHRRRFHPLRLRQPHLPPARRQPAGCLAPASLPQRRPDSHDHPAGAGAGFRRRCSGGRYRRAHRREAPPAGRPIPYRQPAALLLAAFHAGLPVRSAALAARRVRAARRHPAPHPAPGAACAA